jgi:hypothetical protein
MSTAGRAPVLIGYQIPAEHQLFDGLPDPHRRPVDPRILFFDPNLATRREPPGAEKA